MYPIFLPHDERRVMSDESVLVIRCISTGAVGKGQPGLKTVKEKKKWIIYL